MFPTTSPQPGCMSSLVGFILVAVPDDRLVQRQRILAVHRLYRPSAPVQLSSTCTKQDGFPWPSRVVSGSQFPSEAPALY
ncbi:hypothetical protein FA13DRAFT_1729980 [Coprinellus micaceus]|uniref:Uncharacterized protein n=1 Tax=Coprinellus micaceus TaxID=71717 RepID=A0A4Y7THR2_COPMI|nr:hypothetical protein FA13DRAFT_1729980 [Coprinellus micaceus]